MTEVVSGEMEQGRPPGLRAGASQRILLAANAHPEFPAAGRYTFNATIDGEVMRTVSFEVMAQTPVAGQPIPG